MCLTRDEKLTAERKAVKNQIEIRYKIVAKNTVAIFNGWQTEANVHSVYQREYNWRVGYNEAEINAHAIFCGKHCPEEVHAGIHVFINKEDAEEELTLIKGAYDTDYIEHVIMPVKCNTDDLIAVGLYPACRGTTATEAYKRVFVEELPA